MEALPGAHDTNNQLTFPEGKEAIFPSLEVCVFIYLFWSSSDFLSSFVLFLQDE